MPQRLPWEEPEPTRAITESMRQEIFDYLVTERIRWWGRLEEDDFVARLYDVQNMPSEDRRFNTAARDIWQHRVMNEDWGADWILTDSRFNLKHAPDEEFVRFLCEVLHPAVVRPMDRDEVATWLEVFNEELESAGWEIVPQQKKSGMVVYVGRQIGASRAVVKKPKSLSTRLDTDYMRNMVKRLQDSAHGGDPEDCIGNSKEYLESVVKTVLKAKEQAWTPDEKFPRLVRQCLKSFKLAPEGAYNQSQTEEAFLVIGNNLGAVADKLAELRNWHGTGHGKPSDSVLLEKRHALLVMTICIGLADFIFECAEQEGLAGIELVEPVDESRFDEEEG